LTDLDPRTTLGLISERQAAIRERLQRLVGPGPASFYADACRLMSRDAVPLESMTHLVSHLLREVESAIRDVLQPISQRPDVTKKKTRKRKKSGDDSHREEIVRALVSLGIPENESVATAWLRLPGKANEYGFAARAHRDNLAAPRPVDDEFRSFWRDVEPLFAVVLDRFEAKYLSSGSLIERLKGIENPSVEDAKEFLKHVPHTFTAHQRFFSGLGNPAWLEPLRAAGALRRPPAALTREQDGKHFIEYPGWPEGEYLERMAANPGAQGAVAGILLELPETDNLRIHYHLVGAALALPVEAAAAWVEGERAWLERQGFLPLTILANRLATLTSRLASGKFNGQALGLLKSLLALQVPPSAENSADEEAALYYRPEPRAHVDAWHYSQVLEVAVPVLVAADNFGTLTVLCDLLEEAIAFSGLKRTAGAGDTSYIWRRAVENDGEAHADEIANTLVTSVRRAAEIVATNPTKLAAVIALLESRASASWIFPRIALHLLRVRGDFAASAVADRLTDPTLFYQLSVRHEYTLLLRDAYSRLDSSTCSSLLTLIDGGPNIMEPDRFSEEELTGFRRAWTRDRLAAIAPLLPPDWSARYNALVEDLGEARHPEFPAFASSFGFIGSETPKTGEQLRMMPPESIAEFLRSWRSSEEGIHATSPEGLGRALAGAVKEDPAKFSANVELFANLDPTYVRSLLEGFHLASQNGLAIEWAPILRLCHGVVERPSVVAAPGTTVLFGPDTDWNWARGMVQVLLEAGLAEGPAQIPIELRAEVWKALVPLTSDPDPTPEREAEIAARSDNRFDLTQYGLRGRALRTVVRYLTWVRRNLGDGWTGFATVPEAAKVLAEHLDPTHDSSVSVRALYGETLLTLISLDRDWVRAQLSKIFPREPISAPLRFAAWNAFLRVWRPGLGLLDLLRDEYAAATAALPGSTGDDKSLPAHDTALAEHLMILYGLGETGSEPDGVIARFFLRASDRLRAHALSFVGRSLGDEKGSEIREAVLDRFRNLWKWRLEGEEPDSGRTRELLAYGWWFASGAFDTEWAAAQLVDVYERTGTAPADYWVLVRLAKVAHTIPRQAAELLRAMAKDPSDSLQFSACRAEVAKALTPALEGSDPDARAIATEVINRLASKGASEFGSLLGE
jgi:hypothetical protein